MDTGIRWRYPWTPGYIYPLARDISGGWTHASSPGIGCGIVQSSLGAQGARMVRPMYVQRRAQGALKMRSRCAQDARHVRPRGAHGAPQVRPRCAQGALKMRPRCAQGAPEGVRPRCAQGAPKVRPRCALWSAQGAREVRAMCAQGARRRAQGAPKARARCAQGARKVRPRCAQMCEVHWTCISRQARVPVWKCLSSVPPTSPIRCPAGLPAAVALLQCYSAPYSASTPRLWCCFCAPAG